MQMRLLFFLALFFAHGLVRAAAPVNPLQNLAVLEDPRGTDTIDTILAAPATRFKPLPGTSFAGGLTRSVFWFRFTISQAGETWLDIQPAVLDDLRLYEADATQPGAWRERRAGDTLPFAAREVPYRAFVFKIKHSDASPRTYYLRMQTTSASAFSPRLWHPDEFVATASLEAGLLFASIAIIFTVLLLNVNAWFWLRDSLTPWFLAYLLALALFFTGITGFVQQYVFPDLPAASYYFVSMSTFLIIAAGNGFYRRLFGVERSSRIIFGLYALSFWLPLLALPIALLGYFTEIAPFFNVSTMVMTIIGIGLSVRLWRQGAPGAIMMLLANLISMASILVFVFNVLGVIAGGFFIWHSLQVGALGSILALQIAVGARYRSLRDASVKAEQEALHERGERRRLGQFLAMLAHELRTSLSVLQMSVGVQPMTPRSVASAERAMTAMSEVIEHSIQAEKLSEGTLQLEHQPCDVATLLAAVIADSRDPTRIETAIAVRPTLITEAKLLRVILANLVDNAIKYGKAGTSISVSLAQNEKLAVRICNAVGSAGQPDPARMFEKYYRGAKAHESTGSGLGLYIAKSMTTLLGGELDCEAEGESVCFELRL